MPLRSLLGEGLLTPSLPLRDERPLAVQEGISHRHARQGPLLRQASKVALSQAESLVSLA